MSRKSKAFSQLYDYLLRDKNNFSFTRNTYSNSKDKKDLIREFMKNSDYLKNSRGKNYLYHELLSLEENNLSIKRQKEILLDLATKYQKLRAENHLSFGVIHEDKNNVHLHLMLSSNEIEGEKRVRLSKKELASIQATLEDYKNQNYKELSNSSFYQDKKDLSKQTQKEQEIKHKRKTKTVKEQIKEENKSSYTQNESSTYEEKIENNILDEFKQFYSSSSYIVLGVSTEDNIKTIKKKYKALIRIYHPDINQHDIVLYTEISQNLNNAYDKLKKIHGE